MTRAARLVLQDVRYAIWNHTDKLGGEAFRVSWFSIVGLLRAVGHVLVNVDSQQSPAMAAAIRKKWDELQASKPEPAIFWGFIEAERNYFLKSGEHGVLRGFDLAMYSEDASPVSMKTMIVVSRSSGIDTRGIPTPLRSLLDRGPFKGRHELDVAKEAAAWWTDYLASIDQLASVDAGDERP